MRILVLLSGSWIRHLSSLVWASDSSSEKKKGVGDQQFLKCICITITWLFYKSTCLGQNARTIQSEFLGVEPTEQSCWELPKWHQCAAKVENWVGISKLMKWSLALILLGRTIICYLVSWSRSLNSVSSRDPISSQMNDTWLLSVLKFQWVSLY